MTNPGDSPARNLTRVLRKDRLWPETDAPERSRTKMHKTTVYQFEYFDRETRCWAVAPDRATEAAIASMGGVILRDSALEVDSVRVGFAGILRGDPGGDP